MYDSGERQNKVKIEAVLRLADGSEILGVFFVSPQARFTDLLNDPREFLPIETTSGSITVVRKNAIIRATPVKQDVTIESTDPYSLIGVPFATNEDDLRAAYHQLVRQYHPDHLISLDLPQPFIDFATGHMARINDAFQRICREKGYGAQFERREREVV